MELYDNSAMFAELYNCMEDFYAERKDELKAKKKENEEALEKVIQFDVILHAYMFMQSRIPVLYSGDEIAVGALQYLKEQNIVVVECFLFIWM